MEIKTVIDSEDIIENVKTKTKSAINKKNSIRIKCNSDIFLIILRNELLKTLKILEMF